VIEVIQMDELVLHARPRPTAARPLLGQTLLVVEDSRFASEAIRLLALRSGARIRRADCLASARRHLGAYRPDVVIVDLGLPDGSGLELIRALSSGEGRPRALIATSGAPESEGDALAAGADGFLPKPVESLGAFQAAVLALLPTEVGPLGPRLVSGDVVEPDRLALSEDIERAGGMLREGRVRARFVADFLRGVAATGHDGVLAREVERLRAGPEPALRDGLERLIAGRRASSRALI
jgi:CheY-like chemotaxis protein